jgi:hypothetical protein
MQPELIAGRYKVLRAIGRGGMGTVWLCRDEVLGREVAVKQIGALPGESPTETKRAMREARSAAALNHPNAVAVYDVVRHEGLPWLVMEYVEGQTLADEISRDGQISPQRVADIGAQLAGALARAHERRIVHRDIKPGNVLIDKAGRPKISDFGIARGHGDEQLTQVGFITGTPGYLSPELARGGDPLPSSDVWALGATLYTAVEGQPPYKPRSNPIALLRAIAVERPRPMTHAGVLAPALEAMMHEDPERRWDMATSAKRLGSIARITQVMPRVDPAETMAMAVPSLEPTQALPRTQRLEVAAPVVAAQDVAARAVKAPLVAAPVVKAKELTAEQVAAAPVVAAPVAKTPSVASPAVQGPSVASPVANARVVAAPVFAAPVAKAPGVNSAAAKTPVVAPPLVPAPGPPLADSKGSRRWLPLLLVALLVVGLVVTYLSQLGHQDGLSAVTATKSTAPAKPPATSAPKIAEQPTPSPAPSSTTVAPPQNVGSRVASFLTSYYANVTKNTSLTWGELTPTMQQRAQGRSGYDGFWKTISSVTVGTPQVNTSGTNAVVSLRFTKNGVTTSETHRFTLVANNGGYLIDSDTFIG